MQSELIMKECEFKAVRSSGAGGQHVNKVSSKVVLSFNIRNSESLSDYEKEMLLYKLKNRVTKEGILSLDSSESRSQHKNKEIVIDRFLALLNSALFVPKSRRDTRPTRASVVRNKNTKKLHSAKKKLRRKPNTDA